MSIIHPHQNKSHGVKSGDLGGQCIKGKPSFFKLTNPIMAKSVLVGLSVGLNLLVKTAVCKGFVSNACIISALP